MTPSYGATPRRKSPWGTPTTGTSRQDIPWASRDGTMVATNMAGRGTDIKLAREVAEKGGLHVILSEFHESARVAIRRDRKWLKALGFLGENVS